MPFFPQYLSAPFRALINEGSIARVADKQAAFTN